MEVEQIKINKNLYNPACSAVECDLDLTNMGDVRWTQWLLDNRVNFDSHMLLSEFVALMPTWLLANVANPSEEHDGCRVMFILFFKGLSSTPMGEMEISFQEIDVMHTNLVRECIAQMRQRLNSN